MLEVKFYKDGEEYRPTPIEVATMLIQTKEKRKFYKNLLLGFICDAENAPEEQTREIETEMFLPNELKEIAEHLLVHTKKYGCSIEINGNTNNNNVKLLGEVKDE